MASIRASGDTGIVRVARGGEDRGDAIFRGVTLAAGVLVLVVLGAIAVFLILKGLPAIRDDQSNFFTTQTFNADISGPASYGVAGLAVGTVVTSVIALVMAVPVALGVALFVTEYAPRWLGRPLGYVSDLLAAIPSVIYGAWAALFLLPHLVGFQHFLATYFGWIPLFSDPYGEADTVTHSVLAASIVLAIMTLPIIAAISREVFWQVDPADREAALALGATRWETIRMAVFPASRGGVISAVMLGLGRALGETIAVALVIGNNFGLFFDHHILESGGGTIASNIANQFGEATAAGRSALIATGLVLFALTLLVNLIARFVMVRSGRHEATAV